MIVQSRIVNPAPTKRTASKTASVPIPATWAKEPSFVARLPTGEKIPAHLRMFGQPRKDGSRRYALVDAAVPIAASSELLVTIEPGVAAAAPFVWPKDVVTWLASGKPFGVELGGAFAPIVAAGAVPEESNDARMCFRIVFAAGLQWCEIFLSVRSGVGAVDFVLRHGVGTDKANALHVENVSVAATFWGADARVDFDQQRLAKPVARNNGQTRIVIMEGQTLGDAQGGALTGAILCAPSAGADLSTLVAEQSLPTWSVATNWKESGDYGAVGVVLDPPKWIRDPAGSSISRAVELYRTPPFFFPLAWWEHEQAYERPGSTGAQPGQGDESLHDIATTGRPERLYVVGRDVQQEHCRPNNFVSATGERVSAADHPECYFWNGRPFRQAGNATKDPLGRTFEYAEWDSANSQRGAPWWLYDREHWNLNGVLFHALMSGDLLSRLKLREACEHWIFAHRLGTDNVTVNGYEASRAVGRSFIFAAHAVRALDDDKLRRRLLDSVIARAKFMIGEYAKNYGAAFDQKEVQPFDVLDAFSPPVNHQSDLTIHWNPWQESFIPAAFDAIAAVLEDDGQAELAKQLREIAWRIARTVVLYGFDVDAVGNVSGISGVQWFDGAPPDPNQLHVGVNYDPYGGYTMWQLGAALLAEKWAAARGDHAVAARANLILTATLGAATGNPFDPTDWNHQLLNHIAVVPDPWTRLPVAAPTAAPEVSTAQPVARAASVADHAVRFSLGHPAPVPILAKV